MSGSPGPQYRQHLISMLGRNISICQFLLQFEQSALGNCSFFSLPSEFNFYLLLRNFGVRGISFKSSDPCIRISGAFLLLTQFSFCSRQVFIELPKLRSLVPIDTISHDKCGTAEHESSAHCK